MFYCSNKGKALILFVVLGVLLTFSKLAVLATSSSDSVQSSEVLSSKTEEINLNIKDYKSNDKIDESLNKWDA